MGDPPWWRVSLNSRGTLNVPVDIVRSWGLEEKKAHLYFFLEGTRVVVVTEDEFDAYRSRKQSH
jgi:hypothetical protein